MPIFNIFLYLASLFLKNVQIIDPMLLLCHVPRYDVPHQLIIDSVLNLDFKIVEAVSFKMENVPNSSIDICVKLPTGTLQSVCSVQSNENIENFHDIDDICKAILYVIKVQ